MTTRVPSAMRARLRQGKRDLRLARRAMSLPDKVREVVELQKIAVTTIRRRRPLKDIERVWTIDRR